MPNLVNQILFSELQADFQKMGSCVVVDVGAVNTGQDIEIRTQLREVGVQYRVVRSRLAKRAFDEMGLDMGDALKGRCGIAVAEEEGAIGAAKVLRDWIKKQKVSPIAIKGGVIEGTAFVGAAAAQIAELPDRNTINTMMVCAISGPARGLAGVVNAVAGGLARCIQAKVDKGE
ncbi:MAG: large subunit ribosomal protein L10 [Planctomycetota bacterium]|jgi:large subunit ribosomal protein L10